MAAQDPTQLAYLRALGFEEQQATANAEVAQGQVEDRVAFQRPIIEEEGRQTLRGISQGHEARGVFRSGQHETALAERRARTMQQVGGLEMEGAHEIAGIQMGLATELAALRRQQQERELAGLQQSALRDAMAGLGM